MQTTYKCVYLVMLLCIDPKPIFLAFIAGLSKFMAAFWLNWKTVLTEFFG